MDQHKNTSLLEISERVSQELKQYLTGQLEARKINQIVTNIKGFTSSCDAEFRALGMLFYTHYWIWIPDADSPYAKFNGDAGGLGGTGQAGSGAIYTDNLEALIDNTTTFMHLAPSPMSFTLTFFDKHSNPTGIFEAKGIGYPGIGGGTGKWNRT
ncbi:VapA/VapB family virulence-associated protein [Bacillus altitudinis]|uniref:VapA/VapB family virulence-associated protein n=1 Tax=Bacillus altitudinis TaxID=293387 RepID=UPI0009354B2E|nr:VapA/VapB family virulence-associated protein [Bacillus altitudinis]OJT65706.1 hypothetical protein BFP48_00490 [Bacillus altitudinis]